MPGYSHGAIETTVKFAIKIIECYKTWISSLCKFTTFDGPDAKWFETCDQSSSETVTVYSVEHIAATEAFYPASWKGTGTDTDGCITIVALSSHDLFLRTALSYFGIKNPHE
jgi:hypothetical protein